MRGQGTNGKSSAVSRRPSTLDSVFIGSLSQSSKGVDKPSRKKPAQKVITTQNSILYRCKFFCTESPWAKIKTTVSGYCCVAMWLYHTMYCVGKLRVCMEELPGTWRGPSTHTLVQVQACVYRVLQWLCHTQDGSWTLYNYYFIIIIFIQANQGSPWTRVGHTSRSKHTTQRRPHPLTNSLRARNNCTHHGQPVRSEKKWRTES